MTEDRRVFWKSAFAAMACIWRWFEPSPERAVVWDAALADLSLEQLAEGVNYVLGNSTSSEPPKPGDIRDGALGKVTWVDEWQRDAWGSIVLHGGAPVSVGRRQVRVREGEPGPRLLSWGQSTDGYLGGTQPRGDRDREPLELPGAAGEVVKKLAQGMVPAAVERMRERRREEKARQPVARDARRTPR